MSRRILQFFLENLGFLKISLRFELSNSTHFSLVFRFLEGNRRKKQAQLPKPTYFSLVFRFFEGNRRKKQAQLTKSNQSFSGFSIF